ncbi:Breast cancer suppressor protein BRCT [Cordyceps javanica]|uniref:Breast cancer suppressor protein BRCT n=1 Tax=Cordyceps javanica TaxID=43265 RepID=A0A545W2S4_9HYPO|nr:Breast cancer suppressor protein BRCT [Cordyceps javanica]TQW08185.1 Breast cancer suppressor protein BRCT [Cordyceps javanica]
MDSPPKRMTRARAAAKANASTVKTTKIVTAAARARVAGSSTATAATAANTTKRKTRADDTDDDDNEGDARARRLRCRPSRALGTVDGPASSLRAEPVRPTRVTRTAKKMAPEQAKDEPKPTRGRSRRNTTTSMDQPPITAKRTTTAATRSRAGTVSKTAPIVKKSVKFDEPDKENIGPAAKKESDTSGGLHAAPARRPPTPASKGAKSAAASEKKPLSPRKVTQIPVLRKDDDSAGDGSPRRNGATEQVNVTPVNKSVDLPVLEKDLDSTITVNAAILGAPESLTVAFGSPPRRPPTSPDRDTLKSPAKKMGAIPLPGSPTKSTLFSHDTLTKKGTASKQTLFQTPAKRPPSPIKSKAFPSTSRPQSSQDAFQASLFQSPAKRAPLSLKPVIERPAAAAICETPAMKPIAAATSVRIDSRRPSGKLTFEEELPGGFSEALAAEAVENPALASRFNGRLSDVVPRDDPDDGIEEDESVELVHTFSFYEQVNGIAPPRFDMPPTRRSSSSDDSTFEVPKAPDAASASKPAVTPQGSSFQLRDKDIDPCHDMTTMSDSDDELDVDQDSSTFTPSFSKNRRSTMGLTDLAQTLGTWSSGGVAPTSEVIQRTSGLPRASTVVPVAEASPVQTSFFEDQMETQEEKSDAGCEITDGEISDPSFDEDIRVTNEDLELAQEAEDMSHLHESPCAERSVAKSFSDSLSEASQEYGDENELPVDPALNGPRLWPPTTPARSTLRSCSTTTKVPLKPADESSPTKSRRFSVSRIPNNGTGSLPKSATVISYSPEKVQSSDAFDTDQEPTTPASKCDMWSNVGTPARTPQRGSSSALLRGAVVFVDVHTSEGADASLIFVDLLTQMGAKCVKTWSWNPDSASTSESTSNRIGITHVVFKDGGKRTMEKVRRSNGVVQCVGVSWVLDCEKENEWLDESRYLIDTAFVPRGGARRRKSMEPKALANKNGTLVSTPAKQTSSYNRRQSGIWIQTPPEQTEGEEQGDDIEWSEFILSPVPKTPTPETISRYATDGPETPSQGDKSDLSVSREEMLMRTCPPKPNGGGAYDRMGDGVLSPHKDERVLMRLMAARRKSLQFAPKIASPLSKSWH